MKEYFIISQNTLLKSEKRLILVFRRWTHHRNFTANVWAVEFSNHANNPLIATWTSTKVSLNDFDYGGCSDDLDAETGQGHNRSEELNDQDIITGLNELIPMLEGNTHKEEDQYTRKQIHSYLEVKAIAHYLPSVENNSPHEPNLITPARFMQSTQNICQKIDIMVITNRLT